MSIQDAGDSDLVSDVPVVKREQEQALTTQLQVEVA
jgi:hypothetical protein